MSDPKAALHELIQAGFSEGRIAKEVCVEDESLRVSQSTIHRLKQGVQSFRWDVGQAVLKVRDRLLGQGQHASSEPPAPRMGNCA